jgi:hypothetical protein
MNDEKNQVTVFGGKVNVADVRGLAERAAAAAMNNPRGGAPNGSDYMNFSGKRGIFTIGQENRRVDEDETWVIDVGSFEEGWICWKGGKPASTRLSNIYNGVPVPTPNGEELGPFDSKKGEGWFQAKAWVMKSLDNDQQGYLKINSISGVSAMAELIGEFSTRAAAGEAPWPVVRLDVEEFESQGFKNFKPVFNIIGWLETDELMAIANGEAKLDEFLDEPEDEAPPPPKAVAKATGRRRA